jgi:hypothetical protein
MVKIAEKERVVLDREYLEELKRKASLFEAILSFLEDEYLGYLMEKTEKEENISLSWVKKVMNK